MSSHHHSLPHLFAVLTLVGCGGNNSGSGGDPVPNCTGFDFEPFDNAVATFVADHGLQGASASVVDKTCGVVHSAGYGQYAADRLYLVGSASKVLSAGILLRLADQGLVDL